MSQVRYEVSARVATMTLDRPEKRNSLTGSMLSALRGHVADAREENAVRVLILAAEGTSFCAGADLSEAEDGDRESFAGSAAAEFAGLLTDLMNFPKPIVGRVQGPVAGGGNGLLAICDIVVASTAASFAFREVRVGVAPAVIAVPLLRRIAPGALPDLMLTGRGFDAQEAHDIGLVHRVVDPVDLDSAVRQVIAELFLGGPKAQAATKGLLQRLPGLTLTQAFALAAEVSVACFTSDEAEEGIAAFREKRSPSW